MRLLRKLYSEDDYLAKKGMAKYRNSKGIGITGNGVAGTLLNAPGASSIGAMSGRRAIERATRGGEELSDAEILRIAKRAGGRTGAVLGAGTGTALGAIVLPNPGSVAVAGTTGAVSGYLVGRGSAKRNAERALELRYRDRSKS